MTRELQKGLKAQTYSQLNPLNYSLQFVVNQNNSFIFAARNYSIHKNY